MTAPLNKKALRRVLALLACVSFPAAAQFHDQGFAGLPVVKTDYVSPKKGTADDPLTLGTCLIPDASWPACYEERLTFSQSNYWRQNWPCAQDVCDAADGYWTLIINNEPRADPGNSGPPDQSLPRAVPGAGLTGFSTLYGDDNFPGDTHWRAHLVLDMAFENPVYGGIPFLGFGEFSARGNQGSPIAYLNPSADRPSVLTFGARLWGAVLPDPIPSHGAPVTQPPTLASYVYVAADWGTYAKSIFVMLYRDNMELSAPPAPPARNRWQWPIADSVFYSGADIAYVDAEDVNTYCGFLVPFLTVGEDVDYRIDLTRLFRCMSDQGLFSEPLPATQDIPVTQILWANEATGVNGGIWTDVHDMKTVPTSSEGGEPAVRRRTANSTEYGTETAKIRDATGFCTAPNTCARVNPLRLNYGVRQSLPHLQQLSGPGLGALGRQPIRP